MTSWKQLEQLRVCEPSVKARWLWALGASRAEGTTRDGLSVRFTAPDAFELFGTRSPLPPHVRLTSMAFDAPVEVGGSLLRASAQDGELAEPIELTSVARRWCKRLRTGSESPRVRSASVSTLTEAQVTDLGPTALGITSAERIDDSTTDLEIEIDGQVACGTASVLSRGTRQGLCLHDGDALDLVRRTYLRRRFPGLVGRSELAREAVEELALRSGFLDLRPKLTIPPQWASLELSPTLGWDAAFIDRDRLPVGLMSATRTGEKAWLVHQLVADKDHEHAPDAMFPLHDFMMTFPRVMGGKDARIMCYFDRSKGRNEIYYGSFERLINDPEQVGTVLLQRFERRDPAELPLFPTTAGRLRVREARGDDDFAVYDLIRGCIPKLHADALEILPGMLNREVVHPEFTRQGLVRGRKVFVLAENGRIAAAALCEYGSSELSLFGLFNICHLFRLQGAEIGEGEERQLLAAARRFYRQHGIDNPVIASPPDCFEVLREPGTELVETMAWYVWHPDVLPQYENFYRFRFHSHRLLRAAA